VTRSSAPLEWENSHRVRDLDELAAIKQDDGPDLQIWGSGSLYSGLLERGLLDRLTLLTYPLALGKGKRLFRDGTPPTTFSLASGRVTSRGTAIAVLEPAGPIALGNPPAAPANSRQDERQRRIAEGTW
jgi:dihydrofolate reductase